MASVVEVHANTLIAEGLVYGVQLGPHSYHSGTAKTITTDASDQGSDGQTAHFDSVFFFPPTSSSTF